MASITTIKNISAGALYDKRAALLANVSIKEEVKNQYEYKRTSLKAVGQVPEPGTLVAPGTKVVVFFEDTDDMTIDILEGVHSGYAGMKVVDAVTQVEANASAKDIVQASKDFELLTETEREVMDTFFVESLGLELDTGDPARSSKSAYEGIVASYGLVKG